jgi:eukaryotic translation initiation factor 2C
VLHDENRLNSDQVQQLCYSLCFLSQRATRSIGIVAPTYRAHIAAFYHRMFIEGEEGSDTASSIGRGSNAFSLKQLAPGIELTQYYL